MFESLFDLEKETTKKLVSAGSKFAKELGCHPFEVQVRILYAKDGSPYYFLYKAVDDGKGGKRWEKVRSVKLEEII